MAHARVAASLRGLTFALLVTLAGGCADNVASLSAPSVLPADAPSASQTAVAPPASPSTAASPSPTPSEAEVTIVERTIQQTSDRLDVSITYPQVQGMGNRVVQDAVNEAIRADVEGKLPAPDPVPPPSPFEGRKVVVRGSFQLFRLDGQVVSLLQSLTVSPPTAAHPSTRFRAYNFDLSTGEPIALRSLFKPDTPWLETVSRESPALISQDVNRRHGWPVDEASLLKQGYAPLEKNFEAFTLPPEGLRVTFQEYQVGAYALGSPTIVVSWGHLAPYLAETPLARRLAGQVA